MRSLLLFTAIILAMQVRSQYYPDAKRDYIWNFGLKFGGTALDFCTSPPSVISTLQDVDFVGTNSSICSQSGELLLYTNGKQVANRLRLQMPHGDSLNYGYHYYHYPWGYPVNNSAIILPYPDHPEEYFIVHEFIGDTPGGYDGAVKLLYTKVDMTLDGGLGDVTEKNIPIIIDSLDTGCMGYCRHANGRDWWIVIPRQHYDWFYILLLNPQGLQLWMLKKFGEEPVRDYPCFGEGTFTPDGSMYIKSSVSNTSPPNLFEFYTFDRCLGELSLYQKYNGPGPGKVSSLPVSPNSRYLYYEKRTRLYQADLWAADIGSTEQLISELYYKDAYCYGILGPDGKIYYLTYRFSNVGYKSFSVIHNPDSVYPYCNVQPYAITTEKQLSPGLPRFPNYRLGRIAGSVCDTIIAMGAQPVLPQRISLTVFPNPAVSQMRVEISGPYGNRTREFVIIDMLGYKLASYTVSPWQSLLSVDVSQFPRGIYLGMIRDNGISLGEAKFIVTH